MAKNSIPASKVGMLQIQKMVKKFNTKEKSTLIVIPNMVFFFIFYIYTNIIDSTNNETNKHM